MIHQSLLYHLGKYTIKLCSKFLFDIDVVNYPNLPKGPKIFVANHPSSTDPYLITTLTPGKASMMIHSPQFDIPVFGFILRQSGHICVRDNHGYLAMEEAQKKLNNGESIIIFIEGDISPLKGGFLPPHTGPARLAISHCVPIIPIGFSLHRHRLKLINSTIKGQHVPGAWYFRGPYAATVGRPLYFVGDSEDRKYVRDVTDEIMNKITDLTAISDRRLNQPQTITLNGIL